MHAESGNQCAHPECNEPIFISATENSDIHKNAHICHIFALSPSGPRANPGLTEKLLNSLDNLILLCPNHHALVDSQHESYSADTLKGWKERQKLKMQLLSSGDSVKTRQSDIPLPTLLVDQKIREDVDTLRKSRFFEEFDRVGFSLVLSRQLLEGELFCGTDSEKSIALAWVAHVLSVNGKLEYAEEYLNIAKSLGNNFEIKIADAFVTWQKGDKRAALSNLASINYPAARSAALTIVAKHDGPEAAINWLRNSGIGVVDLNPDGKYILLTQLLLLARWDETKEVIDALGNQELCDVPVLHYVRAVTYLLCAVPTELRTGVRDHWPFNVANFPLASDPFAIDARQKAHRGFIDAWRSADKLNCPTAAKIANEYALWLELMDPENSDEGMRRLENELCRPQPSLRLVFFGIQFGIQIDPTKVDREIERQTALNGGMTGDAAFARFALAFIQETQEGCANYIAQYSDMLSEFIDTKFMRFCQIQILSNAGLSERANEILNQLLEEGLLDIEESRLRRMISEAEGSDPVTARKAQFEQTSDLQDLYSLVEILESKQSWIELSSYGEILFERTNNRVDAERLATALMNAHKTEKLIAFLTSNHSLLTQSKTLRLCYCWSLYYEGELLQARSELTNLDDDSDNPNYRSLYVSLQIALGDWQSLSAYVAIEFQRKINRSAQELISAAQLAFYVGSPYAKDLLFAAVEKGRDDPNILTTAYFFATKAGWEDDPQVVEWLHKAVEFSGEDGPMQRKTLKEVFDAKPEWDNRESEIWRLLGIGEIPISLAAKLLNKSLTDLMTFPFLANQLEHDPRRRWCIPAFSGKRHPTTLDFSSSVGLDVTAMLTLCSLNLLDTVLDAYKVIYVPHSTMTWLFEEKQKATFHQPSRIKEAHQVRDLLANNYLEQFGPSTVVNSDLSVLVGNELAMLISEAEVDSGNNCQRVVVRSSPVYRLSSLLQEEADLTAHTTVLSSCLSVVDALQKKGQLTKDEEKRARAYLQLHEKPWSEQPKISDGAILYLDSLSITYFLHLGILEKLKNAGFKPIASPIAVADSNEFVFYEIISSKVDETIGSLRIAINSRIESGKIKVWSEHNADDQREITILDQPTVAIDTLAGDCDAIISDDRFVNQHENKNNDCKQVPVFSTLDVLEALTGAEYITLNDQLEYRTLLRRAGYIFVPVSEEELAIHLSESIVKDDRIVETAELKAIRENILSVRMSNWLQLPDEEYWLHTILVVFTRILKELWISETDIPVTIARSNWLVDQLDVRGWVHRFEREKGDSIAKYGRGGLISTILTPPVNIPEDVREAYWTWAEKKILVPITNHFPDLYEWLLNHYREKVADFVDSGLTKEGTS